MMVTVETNYDKGSQTISMTITETPQKVKLSPPRIVCAACRNAKGEIVCSPRHKDRMTNEQIKRTYYNPFVCLYRWLMGKGVRNPAWMNLEQGFVDQHCNFYTREDAWVIARKNGQIMKLVGNQTKVEGGEMVNTVTTQIPFKAELYSENLY
jgi:hypothetical protein